MFSSENSIYMKFFVQMLLNLAHQGYQGTVV